MNGKLLGALSLARRAGALTVGFDEVSRQAKKGAAALVMIAADTSPGTAKRLKRACEGCCPVRCVRLTRHDISAITNKPAGTLAITNKDLAALCQKAADEEEAV